MTLAAVVLCSGILTCQYGVRHVGKTSSIVSLVRHFERFTIQVGWSVAMVGCLAFCPGLCFVTSTGKALRAECSLKSESWHRKDMAVTKLLPISFYSFWGLKPHHNHPSHIKPKSLRLLRTIPQLLVVLDPFHSLFFFLSCLLEW
jgi:hypothetical protein